jgi:hypothetical protein
VLKLVVAIEAAMLAVAVALMLHSERQTRFAPAVQVAVPAPARRAALPVSVDLGSTGATRTAALTRGGRAVPAVGSSADSGFVGYKRSAATHIARTR